MEEQSKQSEQIKSYLKDYVSPLINAMMSDIIMNRPRDVATYCQKWLEKYQASRQFECGANDSEDQASPKIAQEASQGKRQRRRGGISAEVFGKHNTTKEINLPYIKKTEQTKTRILIRLKNSFIFNWLDDSETNLIIDSMSEVRLEQQEQIQYAGENYSTLFVIDKGEVQVQIWAGDESSAKHIFTQGHSFGELALLYQQKFQKLVVRANKSTSLYSLSRELYTSLCIKSAFQKRTLIQRTLAKVELFNTLDSDQTNQAIDIAKEVVIHTGEYVTRQGQISNKLWIVYRGKLGRFVHKPGGVQQHIGNYTDGDHFGEYSLIQPQPETSSVLCLTNAKLFVIQGESLVRVLGSLQRLRKRYGGAIKSMSRQRSGVEQNT